jgi:hypothetical protein
MQGGRTAVWATIRGAWACAGVQSGCGRAAKGKLSTVDFGLFVYVCVWGGEGGGRAALHSGTGPASSRRQTACEARAARLHVEHPDVH